MSNSFAAVTIRMSIVALTLAACGDSPSEPGGNGNPPPTPVDVDVQFIVDSIRVAYSLPALAGAIVTIDDLDFGTGVSGTRRATGGAAATLQDLWHLGSNFKAFTSMLAAITVESGDIEWTTTIADAFPELAGTIRAEYEDVTLLELLSHQSGLPRDPAAGTALGTTRTQQRSSVAAWAVTQPPASTRGTYSYTNTGYMLAGAMIERALDTTFEEAVAEHVFTPLGIDDAGFGPQAPAGSNDQPVAHQLVNGQWVAREGFDNIPVYSSAGGVHMSVESWSRFLQEVLRLEAGNPTIVAEEFGSETTSGHVSTGGTDSYGMGWTITNRAWANGRTLTHNGTNTANYSVTWMAPNRGFAVLGVSNSYDSSASAVTSTALDVLAGRLIHFYNTGD